MASQRLGLVLEVAEGGRTEVAQGAVSGDGGRLLPSRDRPLDRRRDSVGADAVAGGAARGGAQIMRGRGFLSAAPVASRLHTRRVKGVGARESRVRRFLHALISVLLELHLRHILRQCPILNVGARSSGR
jgi:hypothetical protein